MPNNVIELVFKIRDNVTAPLNALKGRIGGALKFGIALAGVTSLGAAFTKTVHASREAEDAAADFALAYKNLGATVGKTREEMQRFADEAGKRTIFDDESVLKAQAALLKFQSIQGATFTRARDITLDLASAMRTDLTTAANIVGRAVERPSIALRQLRLAGVIFSADQEKVIKQLERTGQKSEAAAILLDALERKTKGASAAIAQTLSGATARAKNALDNLFEVDTGPLTASFNGFADIFNDAEFKANVQLLLSRMIDIAGWAAKAAGYVAKIGSGSATSAFARAFARGFNGGGLGSPFREISASGDQQRQLEKEQEKLNDLLAKKKNYENDTYYIREILTPQIKLQEQEVKTAQQLLDILKQKDAVQKRSGANRRGGDRGSPTSLTPLSDFEDIDEAVVTVQRKTTSNWQDFMDDLNNMTKTSVEKQIDDFNRIKVALDELRSEGVITAAQYNERLKEYTDSVLSEVVVTVKKMEVPLTALQQKFVDFGTSLADSLGNAIEQGGLHGLTSLRDILKQTLRGMLADILRSQLKETFIKLFKQIGEALKSSGSGQGFWGSVIGAFGSLFSGAGGGTAGRAGGGRIPRSGAWVGENGREWVSGNGMVYNAATLAGMGIGGGGSVVTFAPVSQITTNGLPQEQLAELYRFITVQNAQTQKFMVRSLQNNGLRKPR